MSTTTPRRTKEL